MYTENASRKYYVNHSTMAWVNAKLKWVGAMPSIAFGYGLNYKQPVVRICSLLDSGLLAIAVEVSKSHTS